MTTEEDKSNHPGVLLAELAKVHKIAHQKELAELLGVSRIGLNQVMRGRRAVSPLMALRLEALFGTPARKFLEQQNIFDLQKSYESGRAELDEVRNRAQSRKMNGAAI